MFKRPSSWLLALVCVVAFTTFTLRVTVAAEAKTLVAFRADFDTKSVVAQDARPTIVTNRRRLGTAGRHRSRRAVAGHYAQGVRGKLGSVRLLRRRGRGQEQSARSRSPFICEWTARVVMVRRTASRARWP